MSRQLGNEGPGPGSETVGCRWDMQSPAGRWAAAAVTVLPALAVGSRGRVACREKTGHFLAKAVHAKTPAWGCSQEERKRCPMSNKRWLPKQSTLVCVVSQLSGFVAKAHAQGL